MGNNKTCPYCSPDKKINKPIVKGVGDFLAVENDGTVAFGDDGAVSYYEHLLNFCPMCGRKLDNGKEKHKTKPKANSKKPKTNYIDEVLMQFERK